jgi:hypothetical protein
MGCTFQFGDVFSYWRLLVQGAFATIGFTVAAILCSL